MARRKTIGFEARERAKERRRALRAHRKAVRAALASGGRCERCGASCGAADGYSVTLMDLYFGGSETKWLCRGCG